MTSTEYDRSRLEALPAAVKILDKIRWDLCTDNRPAWSLLYDAAEHTKKQNAAEWKAYFTPQPDPPPAPLSDLLSFQAGYLQNIVKERADAIRHPEPTPSKFNLDVADLRGLPTWKEVCPACRQTIVSDTPHSCEAPGLLSLISGTKGDRQ